MSPFRARPARPQDAEAFTAVIAAVAEEAGYLLTEAPVDQAAFTERVRGMLEPGCADALWVLEQDERSVGGLGLHPTNAAGVATLGMALLPEARGQGGGGVLLRAALDHAEPAGLHKVELEVFPGNGPAIALYAAHGFQVEGLRRAHYLRRDGTRRDVLLMARLFGC